VSALLRTRITLAFLILTTLGSACQLSDHAPRSRPQTVENLDLQSSDWDYVHLRAIDPVDAPLPSQDIIAAYVRLVKFPGLIPNQTRFSGEQTTELQIRIDVLDLAYTPNCDIFLLLDYRPGGLTRLPWGVSIPYQWDKYIQISAGGEIRTYDVENKPGQELIVRVERNPSLDTLIIDLSGSSIQPSAQGIRFQLFVTEPGRMQVIDETVPIHLDDDPPKPAQVLFAFWNSMPAYTPIQAIRRWDGAHTGPLGGRHGLFNLLRTARNERIPLVLLDLKSPISLVALDYLDALPMIRSMVDEGLLVLPETLPEIPSVPANPAHPWLQSEYFNSATRISREISAIFRLPASQYLTAFTTSHLPKNYPFIFWRMGGGPNSNLPDMQLSSPFLWQDKIIIPIPGASPSGQASSDGLSLAIRTQFINSAFLQNQTADYSGANLLVLGGDLPTSEWGVPQIARSAFHYISEHPWISVLGADDLAGLRIPSVNSRSAPQDSLADIEYPDPTLPGERAAWLAMFSLYGPQYPFDETASLTQNRDRYQIGLIQQAYRWAAQPYEMTSCEIDIDRDGSLDCLITTKTLFTVLSLKDGSIRNLFIRNGGNLHQVIAPMPKSTHGTTTLSTLDPLEDLSTTSTGAGGAFGDQFGPYKIHWEDNRAILDGDGVRKAFEFTVHGFDAVIQSNDRHAYSIAFGLDPWFRFQPDWDEYYLEKIGSTEWVWGLLNGPRLAIRSNAELFVNRFQAMPGSGIATENPDREIHPSFFIPFPMAFITTQGRTSLSISIELLQDKPFNISAR